ncbi:Uncharacterised protein [Vibrio cholerae]|nr:Uncharacterised protein [Vibrio cholerae]
MSYQRLARQNAVWDQVIHSHQEQNKSVLLALNRA